MRKEVGVGYGTLRRLMEREIDEEALGFLEEEIFLGIDEHSFRHQELVHTVTEVKKRRIANSLIEALHNILAKLFHLYPRLEHLQL